MGRILGNCVNDGPRDPNNPDRVHQTPVTDTEDPAFIEQQQPEIDWMQALLAMLRALR